MKNIFRRLNQLLLSKKESSAALSLKEQLAYTPILERRPFNTGAFYLEENIFKVLSSQKDSDGRALVSVMMEIFTKIGYFPKNNDGYKDKKKDILVSKSVDESPFLAIQCKSYTPTSSTRISSDEVASFAAYTQEFGENRIFVTSSYFNAKAIRDFSHQMHLIDRQGLIQLLIQYFPNETINVLNALSLYELHDNCQKCKYGRIQEVRYSSNTALHCTNCKALYKRSQDKLIFKKYEK